MSISSEGRKKWNRRLSKKKKGEKEAKSGGVLVYFPRPTNDGREGFPERYLLKKEESGQFGFSGVKGKKEKGERDDRPV